MNTQVFILFANKLSGSLKARHYLELDCDILAFPDETGASEVRVFDLVDSKSRAAGLAALIDLLDTQGSVRVIAAGGDGTLVWVIEECLRFPSGVQHLRSHTEFQGTGKSFYSSGEILFAFVHHCPAVGLALSLWYLANMRSSSSGENPGP